MGTSLTIQRLIISLIAAPVTKLGGQEIRWGRIAKYFLSNPHYDVHIVINSSLQQCLNEIQIRLNGPNVRVVNDRPYRFSHDILSQWALWKTVQQGSIIHVPAVGIRTIYTALLCKHLKKSRVVFSYTTATFRKLLENPKNKKGFKIVQDIADRVDLFEVINPSVDWQGIVPEKKLRISPCSFSDPEVFTPSNKVNKVVFAGHLSTAKGVYRLIEILQAWPTHDQTEIFICGDSDGSESSEEAQRILDNLCSRNPKWSRARLSRVSDEMSNAKVFLSLQEFSNYPSQSLLEAMLCGCCVVATDTGETDLLVKKPFGTIVSPHAPAEDFVDAIQTYLQMSPHEIQEYSKAARHFVLNNHTIEKYASHIMNMWRELSCTSTCG
jgi:glycosyltransferase involved in cell wall biosynthesis